MKKEKEIPVIFECINNVDEEDNILNTDNDLKEMFRNIANGIETACENLFSLEFLDKTDNEIRIRYLTDKLRYEYYFHPDTQLLTPFYPYIIIDKMGCICACFTYNKEHLGGNETYDRNLRKYIPTSFIEESEFKDGKRYYKFISKHKDPKINAEVLLYFMDSIMERLYEDDQSDIKKFFKDNFRTDLE